MVWTMLVAWATAGGDGEMTGLRKKAKEGMESIIRMYYKHI